MSEYEDNEEEVEPEETPNDPSARPLSNDDEKLQNDFAQELKKTLNLVTTNSSPDIGPTPSKVAIIGLNDLGSATAFLLICRQVVTDVILIDQDAKRLAAEYADLSACTTFVSGVNLQASNQLASCEGARVVVLCDVNDHETISKDATTNVKNVENVKTISRSISLYAPDCVMIIGIQPFELMTQLCASVSVLPAHCIFAPGTMIDSAHFKLLISEKLEISPASVTGLVLGEHAQHNLPLWTSVTVGGVHLLSENSSLGNGADKDRWNELPLNINRRQQEIKRLKGNEVWSISMASNELVECILRNKREIHPVTVNIKGHYDVKTDLFLSIPGVIGEDGISHLITTNRHQFSNLIDNINTLIKRSETNE